MTQLPAEKNMTDYKSSDAIITPEKTGRPFKRRRIRALVAYWILGLCNNYGYVVMLTAAADIISEQTGGDSSEKLVNSTVRDCTYLSTGAILLADILPSLAIKVLAPFLPFFVHIRIACCVAIACSGYLMVAYSQNLVMSLAGVVLTSFCSGLGEATLLQYSTFYEKNVISTWSSGTGGAGVIGSVSYSVLQVLGIKNALLVMLVVPVSMALSFWLLLPKPSIEDIAQALEIQTKVNEHEIKNPKEAFIRKLQIIPGLMKYIIPFMLVYLFEYFINQGMFELIEFKDSSLSTATQYRWFQVTYQVGVFLSRSSVNIFHIRQTWIMTILQGLNVIVFTTEAIYHYIPNFYVGVAMVLWEGLLGGSSYVNTFYRISTEVPEENKQFSMAITTFGDSIGISLAGILSIYAHNLICDIPLPT